MVGVCLDTSFVILYGVAMCDLLQRQLFDIRELQPMLQKEIVLQLFVVYL